jgi:hypothetical protein
MDANIVPINNINDIYIYIYIIIIYLLVYFITILLYINFIYYFYYYFYVNCKIFMALINYSLLYLLIIANFEYFRMFGCIFIYLNII